MEENALKNIISDLEPKGVMKYFEKLCAVPRGSGKTQAATQFCIDFATEHGLRYYTDKTGNVVIYKNASPGCEKAEPVIIQGHLDMVWEKAPGVDFNFETQGLNLAVDGDYINASGTTLGGDDGIAVAMALALLEDNSIKHPPIEAVFTVDEETGMFGANALDTSVLKGRKMLNIDSEEEGTLLVSCAGGERAEVVYEGETMRAQGELFSVTLYGLHGGHSGTEIDKGYLSANKLMGEILGTLFEKNNIRICSVKGGTMDNAITRECTAVITTRDTRDFIYNFEKLRSELKQKYSGVEPGITLVASPGTCGFSQLSFDAGATRSVINLLKELPQGVISMSKKIDGMVETSLNMGVLKTEQNKVIFVFSVRSSVDSKKEELVESVRRTAEAHGATVRTHSSYPAWEFVENSPLQKVMTDVYHRQYGSDLNVTAIHAGLECGIFCGKIKGLDCVSFGPDILEIHTTRERLSISSVQRVWKYLLAVLEELGGKPDPASKIKRAKKTEKTPEEKKNFSLNNLRWSYMSDNARAFVLMVGFVLIIVWFLFLYLLITEKIEIPKTDRHYNNAVEYIEQGDYESALEELRHYDIDEMVKKKDAYDLYRICKSHEKYKKGDYEEALDEYYLGDKILRYQSPEVVNDIKEFGKKVKKEYQSSSNREVSERQSLKERERERESSKKARESSEAAERSEREKTSQTTERYTAPLVVYDTTKKKKYYEETTTAKSSYDYDEYGVDEFGDAEDFYDWYYDDFYDFEEAEEYFNEYY